MTTREKCEAETAVMVEVEGKDWEVYFPCTKGCCDPSVLVDAPHPAHELWYEVEAGTVVTVEEVKARIAKHIYEQGLLECERCYPNDQDYGW
jgi:hypothetical protein